MNSGISWQTFVWAIIVGMGFHVGWGLISIIAGLVSGAVAR